MNSEEGTNKIREILLEPRQRKPRLSKEKAKAFVEWLKNSDLRNERPQRIHDEYLNITGIDLDLGFVRNMKKMVNFS